MPKYEFFAPMLDLWESTKSKLNSGLDQESLGSFLSPPRCYLLAHPPDNKEKGNKGDNKKRPRTDDTSSSSKRHRTCQGTRGWLKYSGRDRFPTLPTLTNNCRMCKEFIIQGMQCSKDNQSHCKFGVHVQYSDLTREDKAIVDDYVARSRTLSFVIG